MSFRIERLWAFVSVDPDDGDEGLISVPAPMVAGHSSWLPLIAADRARLDSLRPFVNDLAARTGKAIRFCVFEHRVDLETIGRDS